MTSKKRTSSGAGRSGEHRYESREQFRDEKRAQFQSSRGRPPQKNNNLLVYGIIGAAVVLVIGFIFMSSQGSAKAGGGSSGGGDAGLALRHQAGTFTKAVPENGEFRLAKTLFDDRKAKFFTYNDGSKDIDFFVFKSSDGVVRAAIDACDVCFQNRKGYHEEGDEMVCNNCGQRFPSIKINEVKGGCNPAPLTRTDAGDSVVIKASDIAKDNRAESGQPLF